MIKVCHITSAHPDGDVRIFHKECVTLAKAGFETYCVVPNADTRMEKGVQIVGFPMKQGSRFKRFWFTVSQVYQEALKLDCDVYHLHDPELLLIARKLKRKTGAKIIFDSHEDVPKQIKDKHWIPKFLRNTISNIYATYEKSVCRNLDAVVSVTPIICSRFSQFHNRVVLVANFPDVLEFDFERKNVLANRKACYVGGLFESRGIRELVQALEFLEVELHLAGWFNSMQFEQEIQALPGWKKVVFYGKIDRGAIKNLLSSASVGIVTLLPTASYKEAYPIKMFEYMAAGIAVLASDFPLWRDLVERHNCTQFVDPANPREIAERLDMMFESSQLAEWGNNGRQAILQEINWENESKKLIALYAELTRASAV